MTQRNKKKFLVREKSYKMKKFKKMWKSHNLTPRRSTRERNPPNRYTGFVSSVLFIDDGEPSCFQQAIDCADNAKWKMEMK